MARDDIDLMPDDVPLGDDDEAIDLENLTVDFSTEEADSEARLFVAIPTGAYHVKVIDCKVERSKSEKNFGKPYYRMTLVVQDGKYRDRRLWTNVMLWSGAGYTLAQIMKAMGLRVGQGSKVPTPEQILGYDFIVLVQKQVDKYKVEKGEWDGEGPKPTKNEVKGFKKWDGNVTEKIPGEATAGTLLP